MPAEPGRPKLVERLAERRETHLQRSRPYRVLFTIAGGIVLLAGLVMLVAPGPALVVIPIGLAMLAMEFAWAERMLAKALEQAESAQQKASETSRTERILIAIAVTLAVAALVAAWLIWDIPLLPG